VDPRTCAFLRIEFERAAKILEQHERPVAELLKPYRASGPQ